MATAGSDPRIEAGMAAQLDLRRRRLAAGERPIGWKAGFGAPAAMRMLGLDGPLAGFLTDAGLVESGDAVSLAGWSKPVAEPEIAVYLGHDLGAGASDNDVRAAIAALGPAIELADLDRPPEDVETILAGNIYHRHVLLGPRDTSRAGARLDEITGRVLRGGEEVAATADLEANTGRIVDVLRRIADTLAGQGERLRAGEFVIAGSVVPPIFLEAGDDAVEFVLDTIGSASVRFAWR